MITTNTKSAKVYSTVQKQLGNNEISGMWECIDSQRCAKAQVWILHTIGGEPPIVLILFVYISFKPWNDPIYIANETVVVKVVTSHK